MCIDGMAFVLVMMMLTIKTGKASPTLFAITTADTCAETLAYGMASSWDGVSAFLCVDCDTASHNIRRQVDVTRDTHDPQCFRAPSCIATSTS